MMAMEMKLLYRDLKLKEVKLDENSVKYDWNNNIVLSRDLRTVCVLVRYFMVFLFLARCFFCLVQRGAKISKFSGAARTTWYQHHPVPVRESLVYSISNAYQ